MGTKVEAWQAEDGSLFVKEEDMHLFVQDWMRKNPELAHPSVGRKIPVVHAPRELT